MAKRKYDRRGGAREGAGRPRVRPIHVPPPEKTIDFNQVEALAAIHCTQEEIAHFFNLSKPTIERFTRDETFQEYYHRGLAKGRISVRRKQVEIMNSGSPALAIWLGKQLLGQRDQPADVVSEEREQKPALPSWLMASVKEQSANRAAPPPIEAEEKRVPVQ